MRSRFTESGVRAQTASHVKPAGVAGSVGLFISGNHSLPALLGDPDVGSPCPPQSAKVPGCDADHREFFAVEERSFAGQRGIAAEVLLPESIAQHDGATLCGRLVWLRRESATQQGLYTQRGEVVLGNHFDGHFLALPLAAYESTAVAIGHHVGEGADLVSNVKIIGI